VATLWVQLIEKHFFSRERIVRRGML